MLFQFRVYARDLAKNVLLTAGPAPVQWQQNLNFKFEPLEQESYSRKEHPETRCRQLHSHVQINTHTHTVTQSCCWAPLFPRVSHFWFSCRLCRATHSHPGEMQYSKLKRENLRKFDKKRELQPRNSKFCAT